MTISGGGGGKKIPPGATPAPKPPTTPATSAPAQKTEPTKPATPTTAPAATPTDGFEKHATDPRATFVDTRGHLPAAEQSSTSGINSMVRLLEETRAQILDEHKALREKSMKLVGELAKSGFERSLVDQKRQELAGLRERLAHLRKRLQHIQRRLKTALGKSQKHGDVDVGKAIAAHLEKMKKLEPGVQKALLALLAMEQAFAGGSDGATLTLHGDATAEERGSALARVSPGSVVARAGAALLSGEAPVSSSSSPSRSPANSSSLKPGASPDGLDALRELADTFLQSIG